VRDIVRRTELASGTFYNYFDDKESIFRAVVEATGAEARRRVRAARTGAGGFAEFVEAGYRAYFSFIVEDPATFAFMRRNALGAAGVEDVLPLGGGAGGGPRGAGRPARARSRLLRARDGRGRRRARRAHGRARAAGRRGRNAGDPREAVAAMRARMCTPPTTARRCAWRPTPAASTSRRRG
jgi:AcrR family transcriptional regulator